MDERLVPIDGTLNFRDLGGYTTADGRRVRWRRVFRSDTLTAIDEHGWQRLADLGIREIFDLRRDDECEHAPYEVPRRHAMAATRLAIGERQVERRELVDFLRSGAEDDFGVDYMVGLYARILGEHAGVFGCLLSNLADEDRLPAVFHCTAGKDRAGIAAALVLSVLGVDRETVLDDYELSNEFRFERRIKVLRPQLEAAGIDVEKVRPYLSSPRPVLERSLRTIDDDYGGVEAFLVAKAGVEPEALASLRALLLES
jgi:protein-tyrosine phosphatase